MLESVRVAAIAVASKPGDGSGNLSRIEQWSAQAAGQGARLALFPELSLSGFIPNHPHGDHNQWLRAALHGARQMSQPIPGPAVDRLIDLFRFRRPELYGRLAK